MLQPNDDVLKALVRLNNDKDFNTILGWMKLSLDDIKDKLLDINSDRISGAGKELYEFHNLMSNPREMLDMINRNQNRKSLP